MIKKVGGKWCVYSSDGAKNLGCFDSEEKAKKRLGQVEMFKRQREALAGVVLPRAWVRKVCPPCGAKMKKNGWDSIKAEALIDIMEAREQAFGDMPPQMVSGLCEKYGADPGFFTACVADPPPGIDDPEGFCAALHVACTGKATGEHREREQSFPPTIPLREATTADPTGMVWDVIVMREGESVNKKIWGHRRLDEVETLINAVTEGLPMMSFRWETKIGLLRAHSPADLVNSGLRESDFVWSQEGAIREAFIGSDDKGKFVGAKMYLVKEATGKELLRAQEIGTLKFYGLSVNTESVGADAGAGRTYMKFVANMPSIDLVHFPSAGGELIRAVAASVPANLWTEDAGHAAASKQTDRFKEQTTMDWLKKINAKLAAARIDGVTAEAIREQAVKSHANDEGWLDGQIAEFVKIRESAPAAPAPAAPPAPMPAPAPASAAAPGAPAPDPEIKRLREQSELQAKELERIRADNWRTRVAGEITSRKLTEPEAEQVRRHLESHIGDEAALKAEFDGVLKIRESAGWPASAAGPNVVVGAEPIDRIEKSFIASMKRQPVDGVMPATSIKEAYSACTGVINPEPQEIMEAIAYGGRILNQRTRAARRQKKAILTMEELKDVNARESALCGASMAASPTFSHIARHREAINLPQFPNVVANVLHNGLQGVYKLADLDQWRNLSDIETVSDYKAHKFTRVGGYDDAPVVAEGDPYTDVTSPTDEQASATVEKRGDLESITDEAIANDDIGAITRTPMMFIMGMKVGFVSRFWGFYKAGNTTVTTYDGVNWFAAGHSNILTGATAAVTINTTNLDLLRKRMREQKVKNTSETFLGESAIPKYLITSPDMEPLASKFTQKILPVDNQFMIENELHGGLARIIVPFWTDDGTFIHKSWFLQADRANVFAPIKAQFYRSDQPELFIEDVPTTGTPFTNDKIRYKRRWAYKIFVSDHRQIQAARATS